MYKIIHSNKFLKDLKRCKKRGLNENDLLKVIKILAAGEKLPEKYKDHQLHGTMAKYRECHISPDWLLIYEKRKNELIIYLVTTGSHSDLFR